MSAVLTSLEAFIEEHRRRWLLRQEGLDTGHDATHVWLSCACG
jgi:hypothetical protein